MYTHQSKTTAKSLLNYYRRQISSITVGKSIVRARNGHSQPDRTIRCRECKDCRNCQSKSLRFCKSHLTDHTTSLPTNRCLTATSTAAVHSPSKLLTCDVNQQARAGINSLLVSDQVYRSNCYEPMYGSQVSVSATIATMKQGACYAPGPV